VKLRKLWETRLDLGTADLAEIFGRRRNSIISKIGRMRALEGAHRWPMRQEGTGGRRRGNKLNYYDKRRARLPKPAEIAQAAKPSMPVLPVTSLDNNEEPRPRLRFDPLPPRSCVVCGAPRGRGSYCLEHAKAIYQPREEKRV
jgi:hypothetical protein